jgi:hypothetical protein
LIEEGWKRVHNGAAGVLPDSSVIAIVPMMVEALCLHEKGRKLVADHHPLRALVPILSHKAYVLPDPSGGSPLQLTELAAGLEELVRHLPHELSYQAVDAILAVLRVSSLSLCLFSAHISR